MTDTELMEAALNLLLKFRHRQTILADHQEAVEAALEARINARRHVVITEEMRERLNRGEPIEAIKTEADYEAAMSALDALLDLDPAPGTSEYDQLDILATRLEQYEITSMAAQHFGRGARITDPAHGLVEAVVKWEATNPPPEDNRKMTVICRSEGVYFPANRVVLPASITEILMYWPCAVEICGLLNNGETER